MDSFAKYLRRISDELKVLGEDITRIQIDKEKQLKENDKRSDNIQTADKTKKTAQEQFRGISLKSLQPVTKIYKNEKELKSAQENPEIDFINKKFEDIFRNK